MFNQAGITNCTIVEFKQVEIACKNFDHLCKTVIVSSDRKRKAEFDYLQFIALLSSTEFERINSKTASFYNEEGNHFKRAQTDQ